MAAKKRANTANTTANAVPTEELVALDTEEEEHDAPFHPSKQ